MRRFIHATLTKAALWLSPVVSGGVSVWASVDGPGLSSWLATRDWVTSSYLAFTISSAWAIVSYLTRDLGPKNRLSLERNLRAIRATLLSIEMKLRAAECDDDLIALESEFKLEMGEIQQWLIDKMGLAAQSKFISGNPHAADYTWNGDHTPEARNKRSSLLSNLTFRGKLVDDLLLSSVWDDPPPPKFRERLRWW